MPARRPQPEIPMKNLLKMELAMLCGCAAGSLLLIVLHRIAA